MALIYERTDILDAAVVPLGQYEFADYFASPFVASASGTIEDVELYLKRIGSPTGNIDAAIFTNGSGVPGTIIGGYSAAVSMGTPGTSFAFVTGFTGLSAPVVSGTTYWIVGRTTSIGAYGSSDRVDWAGNYPNTDGTKFSDDAASWSTWDHLWLGLKANGTLGGGGSTKAPIFQRNPMAHMLVR